MRIITTLLLLALCSSISYAQPDRYADQNRVVFEDPQEDQILKVNMAFGFLTVLEFPEKPIMAAVGDDALIQVEVPENSHNIVIKPLEESGTTNLFVFTANKRFNYEVIIGEVQSDYVVDQSSSISKSIESETQEDISLVDLIKMTKNYPVLKTLGNINEKNLSHKKMYQLCGHLKVQVVLLDLFRMETPDYLIIHFTVQNSNYKDMELSEKNTRLYVGEKEFIPQYVIFDQTTLKPEEKTEGWIFVKDSHVTQENKFQIGIGDQNDEYKCR